MDDEADDADAFFGTCCACGERRRVRNICMLPVKAPIPGRGWGCFVCGLATDGAVAVVCDACFEADREIVFACDGYAKDEGRIPIGDLTEPHRHDDAKHADDDKDDGEFPMDDWDDWPDPL